MEIAAKSAPEMRPADHELIEIGKGLYEYRGHFISKRNFETRYTILKPAPSKEVFCYANNLMDVEEKVDAFLDHGVDPWGEEEAPTVSESQTREWATTSKRV